MTPQEKAEDLYFKYYNKLMIFSYKRIKAKRCALIAVDEIIKEIINIDFKMSESGVFYKSLKYWKEVKQEIEKL